VIESQDGSRSIGGQTTLNDPRTATDVRHAGHPTQPCPSRPRSAADQPFSVHDSINSLQQATPPASEFHGASLPFKNYLSLPTHRVATHLHQ